MYGVPPKPNPKPSQPDLHQRPWQVSLANIAATSGVQTTYLAHLSACSSLRPVYSTLWSRIPLPTYARLSIHRCIPSARCLTLLSLQCRLSTKADCRDQPLQFLHHPIAFDHNRKEHIFRSDYRLARAPRLHRARHGSEFLVEELYIVITLEGSGLRLEARFWDEQHTRSSCK